MVPTQFCAERSRIGRDSAEMYKVKRQRERMMCMLCIRSERWLCYDRGRERNKCIVEREGYHVFVIFSNFDAYLENWIRFDLSKICV